MTGVPFRTHKCLSSMASMVSNPFLGAESDSLDPLKKYESFRIRISPKLDHGASGAEIRI